MATTITVEGMTCGHCEETVKETLQEVSGVTDVVVAREDEQLSIDGDADATALVEAVEDAGYTPHTWVYHGLRIAQNSPRRTAHRFLRSVPTLTLPYVSGFENSGRRRIHPTERMTYG